MNRKFSSGRSQLIGRGIVYPLPIPLDPVPHEGAVVYGANGQMYLSDGTEWLSIVDEARTAQIAEDISANVIRVIDENRVLTVHHSNPGADFDSIIDALDSLSGLSRTILPVEVQVIIVCLSGHIETKRVWLQNPAMQGWVRVYSEDNIVTVVEELACADRDPVTAGVNPYWRINNGFGPTLQCRFDGDGSTPADYTNTCGLVLRNSTFDLVPPDPDFLLDGFDVEGDAGFCSFDIGFRNVDSPQFRATSGDTATFKTKFNDCRNYGGRLFRSSMSTRNIEVKGWENYGVRLAESSRLTERAPGSDFRKDSDTSDFDLFLENTGGNTASIRGDTLSGYNIRPNTVTNRGVLFDNSSDIVSGALRGDNANGRWSRLADGTQHVWLARTVDCTVVNDAQVFDLPVNFSPFTSDSTPVATINSRSGTQADMDKVRNFAVLARDTDAVVRNNTDTGGTVDVIIHAVGRWF